MSDSEISREWLAEQWRMLRALEQMWEAIEWRTTTYGSPQEKAAIYPRLEQARVLMKQGREFLEQREASL